MRYQSKGHRWSEERLCPKCDSNDLVRIVYGYPAPELLEQFEKGELESGGCCIDNESPKWRCRTCNETFGNAYFD